jgi:dihydroorotate dehydrogenase
VFEKSTECLRQFSKILDGRIPLIGVGGIVSGDQAVIKQQAGASLIQVYSGLIYTGPTLVKDCVDAMTV